MAKGRVMNEQAKRYVVRAGGNTLANPTIETGSCGRTNPLGREGLREAAKEKMVNALTGATEEGAACLRNL